MRRAALVLAVAGCSVTALDVRAPAAIEGTATPFALTSQDGQTVALADGLATGDVVLVFYRGHW